jgi:hypothetical protein
MLFDITIGDVEWLRFLIQSKNFKNLKTFKQIKKIFKVKLEHHYKKWKCNKTFKTK